MITRILYHGDRGCFNLTAVLERCWLLVICYWLMIVGCFYSTNDAFNTTVERTLANAIEGELADV